jgi:uncharacterized protein
MIDIHVHLAALPDGQNGCYISPKMLNSVLFKFLLKRLGLDPSDPTRASALYLERLLKTLSQSRHVDRAVVLAMDGIYGADGIFDSKETEFLITNDYVLGAARRHPERLLPGVSINPLRRDAIEELDRCVEAGAALVKVLPNSQRFDPANPAFKPYWRRMAHHKIPLLSHVGYEFSLLGHDQSVGDPARLRTALEEGVTVIGAHGLSFGLVVYEKYWHTFKELVRRYPSFYWDASALSLVNRFGMLLKIRRAPELHSRMLFATDYPLPSLSVPALAAGKFSGWKELRAIENPFDRHYRLLEILGLPMLDTAERLLLK